MILGAIVAGFLAAIIIMTLLWVLDPETVSTLSSAVGLFAVNWSVGTVLWYIFGKRSNNR